MTDFRTIEARAIERLGSEQLTARLPKVRTAEELRDELDDRFLSTMSRRIFRAGLSHDMVDNKWPAFEHAFDGFVPERVARLEDEALEALLRDRSLIRHRAKMLAVRDNARAMVALAEAHGSFAAWLAAWPTDDVVGLWAELRRRFSQLGGNSAPYFLRMSGKDTFVLTPWVNAALVHWELLASEPRGKRGERQAQQAFNALRARSDRPLAHLSMILAASVDSPHV